MLFTQCKVVYVGNYSNPRFGPFSLVSLTDLITKNRRWTTRKEECFKESKKKYPPPTAWACLALRVALF